jgi:hypothetical protein
VVGSPGGVQQLGDGGDLAFAKLALHLEPVHEDEPYCLGSLRRP